MDKKDAKKLFNKLKNRLLSIEKTLVEIVDNKAWEPLGYGTFVEAWDTEMRGVRLATGAMRKQLIVAGFIAPRIKSWWPLE